MPPIRRGRGADPKISQFLPDLTEEISYRVLSVLQDGSKRNNRPSSFLISISSPSSIPKQCFLKIFPDNAISTALYQTEKAANAQLNEFSVSVSADRVPWPRCFGRLRILEDITLPDFHHAAAGRRALLFQFLPGLKLLRAEDLTETLCEEICGAVETLHKAGVVHNDLVELNMMPEVGFRNIFLSSEGVFILDFDHAKVPRDAKEALKTADSGKISAKERKRRERLAEVVEREKQLPGLEMEGLKKLFIKCGFMCSDEERSTEIADHGL